jgi:hypothetical protein
VLKIWTRVEWTAGGIPLLLRLVSPTALPSSLIFPVPSLLVSSAASSKEFLVSVRIVRVVIVGDRVSGAEEAIAGEWVSIERFPMLMLRLHLVQWALGSWRKAFLLLSLHCQMRDGRFEP